MADYFNFRIILLKWPGAKVSHKEALERMLIYSVYCSVRHVLIDVVFCFSYVPIECTP